MIEAPNATAIPNAVDWIMRAGDAINMPNTSRFENLSATREMQSVGQSLHELWADHEVFRQASFCTASRVYFFTHEGQAGELGEYGGVTRKAPALQPWQARAEATAGTLAYTLNQVSSETRVMEAPWPFAASRVMLPNGWAVSITYGPLAHSSNRPARLTERAVMMMSGTRGPNWGNEATDVEVAIFDASGNRLSCAGDRLWGHVPLNLLTRVIDAVAQMGRREDCPCPTCIALRDATGAVERERDALLAVVG